MFNLERAITKWRNELRTAGVKSSTTLDELESHLRESIGVLLTTGELEERAFERAIATIGNAEEVQAEFNKIKSARFAKIGFCLWVGVLAVPAAFWLRRLLGKGFDWLTCAHILALTISYCTALLMGIVGVYYTLSKFRGTLSLSRQASLCRANYLFSHLAAGMIAVGMGLGLPVSRQYFGVYWRWEPMEIGGLCVIAWLLSFTVLQRTRRIAERATMLMCIGGSILVTLAWFGARILYDHQKGYGYGSFWPIAVVVMVGIQFGFLAIGFATRRAASGEIA